MNTGILHTYCGMRIHPNPFMVDYGTPYSVKRTWIERLFTFPWQPWTKLNWITPQTPKKEIWRVNNELYMHPEMLEKLGEQLAEAKEPKTLAEMLEKAGIKL